MSTFQFSVNKQLRRTGLEGPHASAMIHDGALHLRDGFNHIARIPFDEITRVRFGFVDGKLRTYSMRVWCSTLDTPLEFVPLKQSWTNYRETATTLVQQLLERDGVARIETGSTKFDALLGPALMAVPVIGALAVSVFVLKNEPWWGRLIVPIVPMLVLGLLVWLGVKRHWPRPLREMAGLRVQLPRG